MKKYFLLLFFIFTISCSLIEPTCLIIQNDSEYTISISLDNGNKPELTLEDGKGDFVLVYPGKLKLKVYIETIGFSKEYSITINYIEKKKFIFKIDEN